MIQPTASDIGRRVIYDANPVLKQVMRGKLVGVSPDGYPLVLFDHAVEGCDFPPVLRVFSNLSWDERGRG